MCYHHDVTIQGYFKSYNLNTISIRAKKLSVRLSSVSGKYQKWLKGCHMKHITCLFWHMAQKEKYILTRFELGRTLFHILSQQWTNFCTKKKDQHPKMHYRKHLSVLISPVRVLCLWYCLYRQSEYCVCGTVCTVSHSFLNTNNATNNWG